MNKLSLLFLLIAVCLHPHPTAGEFTRAKCKNREAITIYENERSSELQAIRRLHDLRKEMKVRTSLQGTEIDAYIISSYDEHLSERVEPGDRRCEFISGFTGNNGIAVITAGKAALWTDERYLQQADEELLCEWQIFELKKHPSIPEWLHGELPPNALIGSDPTLVPHVLWEQWADEMRRGDHRLVRVNRNLIDIIWGQSRPAPSNFSIKIQPTQYSGNKWLNKIRELRAYLASDNSDAIVVTSLTEIAYILNLRGKDIPYIPVFKAYLIVTANDVILYTNQKKLSVAEKSFLNSNLCFNKDCVKVKNYNDIWNDLRTMSQVWKKVLLPTEVAFDMGVSEAIYAMIHGSKISNQVSPIIYMRAQKNQVEQEGMRTAHIRDAVAMCEFLSYFEEKFIAGDYWSEMSVAQGLDSARRSMNLSEGLAFKTIVAFGKHASQLHYTPSNKTNVEVTENGVLLIDSGGQYLDGTTDVTRTFHFGVPTAEEKRAYTTVLIALIRLARQKFPENLEPTDLDVISRSPLWEGLNDYPHGTGHGIGSYLSVHESPISIDYGNQQKHTFKPGYFFSNEPGYYKNGVFGVRLENVLEVIDTGEIHQQTGRKFLAFRDVTLVPFDDKLIDKTLMCKSERKWLNNYNTRIREIVGEELKKRSLMQAFYWMMNHTRHVPEILTENDYAGSDTRAVHSSFSIQILSVLSFFIVKIVLMP